MKRLVLFLSALLLFSHAYAYRIDRYNRIFEMGVETDVAASNSYFSVKDILKNEIVVDFKEIASELDDDRGLEFDFSCATAFFANLNLKNGFFYGLSTGLDMYGMSGISKEFFEFLGNGNSLNETLEFDGKLDANLFLYVTNNIAFEVAGFRVGIGPSLFLPVLHAETTKLEASFVNNDDGSIVAEVVSGFKFNSISSLEPLVDKKFNNLDIYKHLDKGWGFDLDMSLEHQVTKTLAGRTYMRLPIVPGETRFAACGSYLMSFEADDFMDVISGDGEFNTSSEDFTYSDEKLKLSRPFRMGAEFAWKPFGQCMKFGGILGFGVKYPWTNKAQAYLEYKFDIDARLFNILGIDLSTAYLKEIFVHQVGIMMNFRVIEFDAGISAQGANFARSTRGTGAGLYFAFKTGW